MNGHPGSRLSWTRRTQRVPRVLKAAAAADGKAATDAAADADARHTQIEQTFSTFDSNVCK